MSYCSSLLNARSYNTADLTSYFNNKKHLKNVGPIRHNEPPHANSPSVATVVSHAACASMSTTTTTTTTTRDRGDRYGPMEWAQSAAIKPLALLPAYTIRHCYLLPKGTWHALRLNLGRRPARSPRSSLPAAHCRLHPSSSHSV